jgi:hypothetical protein
MIVCPMCEHSQAHGSECEVCGMSLGAPAPSARPAPVRRMSELEETGYEDAGAVDAGPALPGLEVTRMAPVRAVAAERVPELEAGRSDAVQVEVALISGIETGRHAAQPAERPTVVASDSVTCRYCRKVQPPGGFCGSCGMKLPRVAGAAAQATRPARAREPDKIRHACGVRTPVGGPCDGCGVFVPDDVQK